LLTGVERVVARAAAVIVGRPSRRPGRREHVVTNASHLILRGIETGSVVPVFELPDVLVDALGPQTDLGLRVAHLGELAVVQIAAVIAGQLDGHPYVVEALAQMADAMQLGSRYDAITLDLRDSHVSPVQATIDAPVRRRLKERVKADKAAAREGMVIGTLVEADFESLTARLRDHVGQAVTVSFDQGMADQIKEALREPATMEGWITFDPETQESRSIFIRSVRLGDQLPLAIDAREFRRQPASRTPARARHQWRGRYRRSV